MHPGESKGRKHFSVFVKTIESHCHLLLEDRFFNSDAMSPRSSFEGFRVARVLILWLEIALVNARYRHSD